MSLRAPTKENALVLIAVDIEGKNTRSRTRLDYEMHPTAGPETSSVGGHPRKVEWAVTPSEGKES